MHDELFHLLFNRKIRHHGTTIATLPIRFSCGTGHRDFARRVPRRPVRTKIRHSLFYPRCSPLHTRTTVPQSVLDRTSPDVIKQVEKVLERKLASLVNQDYTIVGGVDAIVEILNSVDRGTEKHIMETLEVEEPELADEIRKKMFVFEDILSLDDRAIQRVLRDVDNGDLALALKGAAEEVQNVILNNLSKRLAVMIKEDMEYMGPVRMKDVEEAQQKIVNIIRKLEDSAEIVIARGGGDEIIV